jgi:hypothetical protein
MIHVAQLWQTNFSGYSCYDVSMADARCVAVFTRVPLYGGIDLPIYFSEEAAQFRHGKWR